MAYALKRFRQLKNQPYPQCFDSFRFNQSDPSIFSELVNSENLNLVAFLSIWLGTATICFQSVEHWSLCQSFFYAVDTGFSRLFNVVSPHSAIGPTLAKANELFGGAVAAIFIGRYAERVLDNARRLQPIGRLIRCGDEKNVGHRGSGDQNFIPFHACSIFWRQSEIEKIVELSKAWLSTFFGS
jgi:hypothetical protein